MSVRTDSKINNTARIQALIKWITVGDTDFIQYSRIHFPSIINVLDDRKKKYAKNRTKMTLINDYSLIKVWTILLWKRSLIVNWPIFISGERFTFFRNKKVRENLRTNNTIVHFFGVQSLVASPR